MRSDGDENYQRGYEWWMMSEAKKVCMLIVSADIYHCCFSSFFCVVFVVVVVVVAPPPYCLEESRHQALWSSLGLPSLGMFFLVELHTDLSSDIKELGFQTGITHQINTILLLQEDGP